MSQPVAAPDGPAWHDWSDEKWVYRAELYDRVPYRPIAAFPDVHEVGALADHVALVVEPGGVCPVGFVHRDLLHPAPQANLGALGVVQGDVAEGNAGALGVARAAGGGS